MRKILFATLALTGMLTLATSHVSAAPSVGLANVTAAPAHGGMVTNVDYFWHHRHWHHRRWEHNHWRYWG